MIIGVVAHMSRTWMADSLAREVGAEVCLVDDGTLGPIGNHAAVLRALFERRLGNEWLVVLEDDALPVPDFRDQLDTALHGGHLPRNSDAPNEINPVGLVCLYLGTGNPSGPVQRAVPPAFAAAGSTGASWLVSPVGLPVVGYAVRAALAPSILTAYEGMEGEWALRLSHWAQRAGYRWAYTYPSLVDHADGISTISPTQELSTRMPRKAHAYWSPSGWSDRAVTLDLTNCPPWNDVSPQR